MRGPGPVPWVLVGVGAEAIVGAAITYATVVPDADEQLTTLCNNTINGVRFCGANSSTAAPYFASRSRALTATNVLLGAGGAAIVGGLLWYLLSPRRTRVEVRAGWTPEAAVLGIGGRF